jgi:phospholipid-binding lipoprotein MlaA
MAPSLKCRPGRLAGLLALCFALCGCATASNPRDPFEPFNRGVYQFNEQLDRFVLKPTAEAYRFVLPQFVRQSVTNVFSNLNDVRVGLNNTLQGKFTTAYADFGRVMINSTLGVLGLFDIASEAGIEKHQEDFGQTLGWWGIGDGPFLMLPLFGPSSARDLAGFGVDYLTDPVTYVDPSRAQNQLTGTRLVNRRAELLEAKKVLDAAALDEYEFVRDAYLQRRRNLVYDGKPPADKDSLGPPPKADTPLPKPAAEKSN